MKALAHNELSAITSAITLLLPSARVFLFGSYATGKQTPGSDVDICVVAPNFMMRRMDVIHSIRDAIADKTDLPMDILLFSESEFSRNSKIKSAIEYAIAKEGVLLNA